MKKRYCPALILSAPGSNHGKTTVTAALARHHRNQGRNVRVFKTGPDFLDPMILEQASGQPVYQLDLWMTGEAECARLLYEAAGEADIILIEGVMGLFDGVPSSADVAERFNVPVVAVINAASMAQTFGAIAHGLATFQPRVPFAGVFANNIASARHAEMIVLGMPSDIAYLGGLARNDKWSLPSRHLGLVQAGEIDDLDASLNRVAEAIAVFDVACLPRAVEFMPSAPQTPPRLLSNTRIAVAQDAAFSFIYAANLDLLRAMGARLTFFSPLSDSELPDADSIYLPGGYPELHLARLGANTAMKASLRKFFAENKPIYAECGGMLYLLESLTDRHGAHADMVGILSGQAIMQPKLVGLGYQTATLSGGDMRGHTFHHSRLEMSIDPFSHATCLHNTSPGEALYRVKNLLASYLHFYFPSNPVAAAQLFRHEPI